MKIVSIIILGFVLFLSNTAMAERKQDTEAFVQAKTRILQIVSNHISVLNKFKSCVENAKTRPEIDTCRQTKVAAVKALREKNKQARAKETKAKEMEVEPTKSAE